MAQTFGVTGGVMHRRDLYIRATAAYTRPTTLAEVATLLGTATKYGRFEDKTKKHSVKKSAVLEVDDGSQYVQEYIMSFEGSLMNASPANIADFDSTFDNVAVDIILDDTDNDEIKVYKNFLIHGEEEETDGDKTLLLLSGTKKASAKATLIDSFSYAAFI